MVRALEYCHTRGIVHRNLRLTKILIAADYTVRVTGFGEARSLWSSPPLTANITTLWYRAPEVILAEKPIYSFSIDLWAVGAIIAEMSASYPLFRAESAIDQLFKIFKVLGTPTNVEWPGVEQLERWNDEFPKWYTVTPKQYCPSLTGPAIDFVSVSIIA